MAEEVASGANWPLSPFGDFLDYMAAKGMPEWTWTFIEMCSRLGVCHAEPGCFILARPVDSSLPIDTLNSFGDVDPETGLTPWPDAWHILYASGDIHKFFRLAPFELPKLIWQRDGEGPARIYNFKRTKDRIHGHDET